jgi:PAS domain-containing protein
MNNNEMKALTDSQLGETLEAIWLAEPNFAGGSSEGDSVTSTNSASLNTFGEVMAGFTSQFTDGNSSNLPVAQSTARDGVEGTTDRYRDGSTEFLRAEDGGTTNSTGTGGATPAFAARARQQRPQLFGKEVAFRMPLPMQTMGAPDYMSSITSSAGSTSAAAAPMTSTQSKRKHDMLFPSYAVSEDESDRERRRQDRNQREQQRSQQISSQITVLRNILEDAKVECKPDKYSTLNSVVEYVKSLQQRSSLLEAEHKKILNTIRQTTEIMSSQYMSVQASAEGETKTTAQQGETIMQPESCTDENDLVYVQGIDYKAIFRASPFALATTSIDGRFLDCSKGFENLTKFSREELLPTEKETASTGQPDDTSSTASSDISSNMTNSTEGTSHQSPRNLSLFNVLNQNDMSTVYHAMFDILQHPTGMSEESSNESSDDHEAVSDRWSDKVRLSRNEETEVRMQYHHSFVRYNERQDVNSLFLLYFFYY